MFEDTESLKNLLVKENIRDGLKLQLAGCSKSDLGSIKEVRWKFVKQATHDKLRRLELIDVIETGYPENKGDLPTNLLAYWNQKTTCILLTL